MSGHTLGNEGRSAVGTGGTDGMMRIGGIATILIGSVIIIRSGLELTRIGATMEIMMTIIIARTTVVDRTPT